MADRPLVCDTSPLLYLARICQLEILPALFSPVYVPQAVALELDAGRLLRPDTVEVRALHWATEATVTQGMLAALPSNRLGAGERAVMAFALAHQAPIVGLDDRQARLLAKQVGVQVIGTVGLLLRAKRAQLIPSVRPLLDALQDEGFRLAKDTYIAALQLSGEDG